MDEHRVQRRLAAILAADVVGYGRLMERNEAGTMAALKSRRTTVLEPLVARNQGRVVKVMGDGVLVEFGSAVHAVGCAVDLQKAFGEANATLAAEDHIVLRIGINVGDVMVEGSDLYGDGVNVAARLEAMAEPGGILIAGSVHEQVEKKLPFAYDSLGPREIKNIARPVQVYRVTGPSSAAAAPPLPDKLSIAVLPFTNMSGDPEQEYFSDGITEDIITELSRFRNLAVIARNSSFVFRGQAADVKEIGRKLGVRYVVEGSVRKAGNRVRITAQLIEADSGNHVWAERYDRGLEDIFAVQDEVVRAIVGAVPGQLERRGVEVGRAKRSENLTAYDYMLRARWLMWRTTSDQREVIDLYEQALAIDPNCAPAHVGLAQTYSYGVYSLGLTYDEALGKVRHHVEWALAIDDNDAFTHATAAQAYILCGKHDLAGIHAERALAMNRNDVLVLSNCGDVLTYLGDAEAGLELLAVSDRLQPIAPDDSRLEVQFDCQYMRGDYEKAVAAYLKMRAPVPHMRAEYGAALAQLGRIEEARAAIAASIEHAPPNWDPATFALNHVRMCKRPADAERWLDGYRKAGLPV